MTEGPKSRRVRKILKLEAQAAALDERVARIFHKADPLRKRLEEKVAKLDAQAAPFRERAERARIAMRAETGNLKGTEIGELNRLRDRRKW